VNWRRFIVIVLGTVGFAGFFSSFGVFHHLEGISPTKPISAAGQVYQLRDGDYLFYVTREQYRLFYTMCWGGFGLGVLAALLSYRWKVVKNLTPRGWEYPPNQSMKRTAPWRNEFSLLATTPCRGLSLSR
jgi:hypothetical protein